MQEFDDTPVGGDTEGTHLGDSTSDGPDRLHDQGLWSSADLWINPSERPPGWAERSCDAWMPERSSQLLVAEPDSSDTAAEPIPSSAISLRLIAIAAVVALSFGGVAFVAAEFLNGSSDIDFAALPTPPTRVGEPLATTVPLTTTTVEQLASSPERIIPTDPDLPESGPGLDLSGIDLTTAPVEAAPATRAPQPKPAPTPLPIPPVDPLLAALTTARNIHPVLLEQSDSELRGLLDEACGASSLNSALRLANSESKGGNRSLEAALSFWITTGAAVTCPQLS